MRSSSLRRRWPPPTEGAVEGEAHVVVRWRRGTADLREAGGVQDHEVGGVAGAVGDDGGHDYTWRRRHIILRNIILLQGSQLALFGRHFTVSGAKVAPGAIWRFVKVGGAFMALSGYIIIISEYHDVEMQIVT